MDALVKQLFEDKAFQGVEALGITYEEIVNGEVSANKDKGSHRPNKNAAYARWLQSMGCFVLDDVKLLGQVKRQRNIYVHELAEQTFQVTTEHEVALLHDAADLYLRFDTWWFKNMSMRFDPHWNDLAAETCEDCDAWEECEIRNHDTCLERATASTTSMARLEELITLVLGNPVVTGKTHAKHAVQLIDLQNRKARFP